MFLSYSRGDRPLALQILQNLRSLGVDVWWDEDMPGVDWQDYLASKINELAAVLVMWTPLSIGSKNVKDEARLGQHKEKLVNVLVGASAPPFPFDRVNGLPLDGWTGREPHHGWTRVIQTLEERLVAAGGAKPGELTETLRRRERAIKDRRQEVADAETAFLEAQTAEADSSTALESARAEFAAAEGQLRSVIDMQAGPTLLRAAQQQLDAALQARTDSETSRRSAAVALAAASKSLSSAKAELARLLGDADRVASPVQAAPPPLATVTRARSDEPSHLIEPSSTAAPSRPTATPLPWRPIAAVGAGVIVLAAIASLALRSGPGHPALVGAAEQPAAMNTASTDPASRPTEETAAAPRPDPAAALVGRWGIAGLGCASPVTFARTPGGLTRTFGGATVGVQPTSSQASGTVAFRADDGSRYELTHGALSVTPAGATQAMSMTPCVG